MKVKRVLVVDDSASVRTLISSALEDMDRIEVTEAADGFQAVRLVTDGPFDLIITDVNMPEITGLELVRFVRTHAGSRTTPMIVISTEGSEADREKALSLGADDYLVKPFETSQLKSAVSKVLGVNHARRR